MAFPLFVLAMAMVAALGNRSRTLSSRPPSSICRSTSAARAEVNVRRNVGWVRPRAPAATATSRWCCVSPLNVPAMAVNLLNLGWAILNAAGLSFIGLGVKPPT
jgi:peptide/nickel transport system permease protein